MQQIIPKVTESGRVGANLNASDPAHKLKVFLSIRATTSRLPTSSMPRSQHAESSPRGGEDWKMGGLILEADTVVFVFSPSDVAAGLIEARKDRQGAAGNYQP